MITIKIQEDENDILSIEWKRENGKMSIEDVETINELLYEHTKCYAAKFEAIHYVNTEDYDKFHITV